MVIDDEMFSFVHDARLTGLVSTGDQALLTLLVDEVESQILISGVDRLVAMPFLNGNIVYAARVMKITPDIRDYLGGISEDLKSAFFDVYGLTPAVLTKHQGDLFVLESSFGCEVLCAFTGTIDIHRNHQK